jgi:ribosome maturation protein SDO1
MSKQEFQLVRYKHGGHTFEVLTKPGTVLKYRKGLLGWDNVLVSDEVFKTASKAEKASAADLKEAFGQEDLQATLKTIVEKGELQLTAAERKEFVEKRRAEVVNYIHKYYVDPKTKTPHPVLRIENALEQLKVKIDPDQPLERLLADVTKRLPDVLTIKRQDVEGQLSIPHKHMGAVGGVLSKYCQVKSERYTGEGCEMQVSLVPGDYAALIADLNKLTKGEFQLEIEAAGGAASHEEEGPAKGKGKAKPAARKK